MKIAFHIIILIKYIFLNHIKLTNDNCDYIETDHNIYVISLNLFILILIQYLFTHLFHYILEGMPWRITIAIVAPVAGSISRFLRYPLITSTTQRLSALGVPSHFIQIVVVDVSEVNYP